VTIAGNSAVQGGGGLAAYNGAEISLVHVTVAGNTADSNQDNTNPGDGGGLYSENGGHFRMRNSVVADNVDRTPLGDGDIEHDCSAEVRLFGSNLIEDQEGCSTLKAIGTPPELAPGTAPRLLPLGEHGGPTQTIALKRKSPLRDRVARANCSDGENPPERVRADQRGVPRKGRCSIGAYEYSTCGRPLANVVGTPGRDRLGGGNGKDGILGLGGGDKLAGAGGGDGLCGQGGRDRLVGKGGKDLLNGGPGRDVCIGGPGRDRARGCEVERGI
jgi:Ca2+-binding RTX toxin-like protein